jgi:hypothetical protein
MARQSLADFTFLDHAVRRRGAEMVAVGLDDGGGQAVDGDDGIAVAGFTAFLDSAVSWLTTGAHGHQNKSREWWHRVEKRFLRPLFFVPSGTIHG